MTIIRSVTAKEIVMEQRSPEHYRIEFNKFVVFDGHIGKVVRNVDRNIMFSIVHSICII
jgi:hypothetical protein